MPARIGQTSFASGEVSPSIFGRTDIAKYATSLKTCRNFVISPAGSASNRPGTRFVRRSKYYDTKTCIVQEFIFNRDQRYILEVGEEYIRFYNAGAIIEVITADLDAWSSLTNYVVGDFVRYNNVAYYCIQNNINQQPDTNTDDWTAQTIFEVPTPYQEADLSSLRFESSADTVFITSPSYQTRVLQRFGEADWRISLYEPEGGPFMPENTVEALTITPSGTTGSITLTASSAYFDEDMVGALFKTRHSIPGQKIQSSLTALGSTSSIRCFTTWRIITHGTWTAKFDIEKSIDGGSTWTVLRSFSSVNDFNASTSGTEDIETHEDPFLIRATVTDYTSGTIQLDLTTDPFIQEGIAQITGYTSPTVVNATVLITIGTAAATNSWAEGSWSDHRGWPSVARFYQDRLCFAATTTEPMTIWMTQTSNYYNFRRHSTLLDTDGISVNIPSRQLNAINGLLTFKRLIAFTTGSIWSVGPPEGSTLTPTNIITEVEEYTGSQGVNPAVIGNEAIYIQANGKVVRNIGYEFGTDSFTGSDMNVLARHLIERWTIIDLAFQRDPDCIVWMVRSDGVLVAVTYMREQEVVAFHWHDMIDELEENFQGIVESVACVPSDGFDELWMVVQRSGGRYIERMVLRLEAADGCGGVREIRIEDQIFMDSAVEYSPLEIDITNISATDPVVITAPGHGLSSGDIIRLDGIEGMTELNGNVYTVINPTTNTFEIYEG